jgi:tetratricopeptide (TPR) repeat protein
MVHRRAESNREAEAYLRKAQELFPEFTEPGNSYELLSELYQDQGRDDEALDQLLGWIRYDENAMPPLFRAAEIYRKREDWHSLTDVLELSVYIYPYEQDVHTKLGQSAMEASDWDAAIAAFEVLLGLNPSDPAGTYYNLARAWMGKGDLREAKRATLRALEIAPTYPEAQQLLLQLSRGRPK